MRCQLQLDADVLQTPPNGRHSGGGCEAAQWEQLLASGAAQHGSCKDDVERSCDEQNNDLLAFDAALLADAGVMALPYDFCDGAESEEMDIPCMADELEKEARRMDSWQETFFPLEDREELQQAACFFDLGTLSSGGGSSPDASVGDGGDAAQQLQQGVADSPAYKVPPSVAQQQQQPVTPATPKVSSRGTTLQQGVASQKDHVEHRRPSAPLSLAQRNQRKLASSGRTCAPGAWRGCQKSAYCDRENRHRGICNHKATIPGLDAYAALPASTAPGQQQQPASPGEMLRKRQRRSALAPAGSAAGRRVMPRLAPVAEEGGEEEQALDAGGVARKLQQPHLVWSDGEEDEEVLTEDDVGAAAAEGGHGPESGSEDDLDDGDAEQHQRLSAPDSPRALPPSRPWVGHTPLAVSSGLPIARTDSDLSGDAATQYDGHSTPGRSAATVLGSGGGPTTAADGSGVTQQQQRPTDCLASADGPTCSDSDTLGSCHAHHHHQVSAAAWLPSAPDAPALQHRPPLLLAGEECIAPLTVVEQEDGEEEVGGALPAGAANSETMQVPLAATPAPHAMPRAAPAPAASGGSSAPASNTKGAAGSAASGAALAPTGGGQRQCTLQERFATFPPHRGPWDEHLPLLEGAGLLSCRTADERAARKARFPGLTNDFDASDRGTVGGKQCTACSKQATPVWRAGPHGPKTLCNACGVRWMKTAKRSGR